MRSLDRLDLTLIVLVALAAATMAFAGAGRGPANGAVLAIAAIKGRRILLDYLDLRSAPPLWRGLATAWLLLVAGFAWIASVVTALVA